MENFYILFLDLQALPPIVKNKNYPPNLGKKRKLPPNILTNSDNVMIYGEVYNDGHNQQLRFVIEAHFQSEV